MATNEMNAKLISQGTQVESVDGAALVPVATAEGQPQSNITLANLADSLGSAVPLQQTTEQVTMTGLYARTSEGKMVELTKESVASVMAGLMGYPISSKSGYFTGDANDLYGSGKNGIYTINGVAGRPENIPEEISFGMLTVETGGDNYTIQKINEVAGESSFFRSYNGGIWTDWIRLDNFGYNTLADLSSGVAGQIGAVTGGRISTGADMNEIITDGLWTVKTSVNAPENSTSEWALSVRTNKKGDIIQIASPYTGSATKTYTRTRRSELDNSWTSWV